MDDFDAVRVEVSEFRDDRSAVVRYLEKRGFGVTAGRKNGATVTGWAGRKDLKDGVPTPEEVVTCVMEYRRQNSTSDDGTEGGTAPLVVVDRLRKM